MIIQDRCVIGTWPLSGDFGHIRLGEIEKILLCARAHGFREYDTAPSYGDSLMEHCLGNIFGSDSSMLINTKVGNIPFVGKSFDGSKIRKSLEDSLVRLKREQVNILYLHNPRDDVDSYEELVVLMENFKKEGKIVKSGISMAKNYCYPDGTVPLFDMIQDEANLLYLDRLDSYNDAKNVYFRSPLASGMLGGHISFDSSFSDKDHRSGWLKGERLYSILKRVETLQKRTSSLSDLSLQSVAKKYVLDAKPSCKVIFGIKKMEHLDALCLDIQLPPMKDELIKNLKMLYHDDFGLVGESYLKY
ncbi:MAG: hypothetical protein HN353_06720 [Bdellovibrionales bacterium]|jgi:aryl-alcohol dehydrogenase-like predicted oxidoreductase|nr:hypothetical protein [Bdellovibrionales bacterium]MBT3525223.1 hypothetical protein [Bdellovibrionales bacterium]MBT7668251.1 hypothetical protein [Bdellovibrionales bacterium]